MILHRARRHALANETRQRADDPDVDRGRLSPVESRRWLGVGPPLLALVLLAAMGACAAHFAESWLDTLPLRHAHSGLGRGVQELRADPVPGASHEVYTYPEWDFGLIPSE